MQLSRGLGRVVEGHVLDMDKKYIERLLKNYDSQLYLKWNPDKNKGNGLWEVRRRPNTKSLVYKGLGLDGEKIYVLEYAEIDHVHHVMDAEHLDMRIMTRLYEMDTFRVGANWAAEMEYLAERREEELSEKDRQEWRAMIRENKKYYSQLREFVQAGYNPAWFFSSHRK